MGLYNVAFGAIFSPAGSLNAHVNAAAAVPFYISLLDDSAGWLCVQVYRGGGGGSVARVCLRESRIFLKGLITITILYV
jgi:hypothetical protein